MKFWQSIVIALILILQTPILTAQSNAIKLELGGVPLGSIGLSYERVTLQNQSISVKFNTMTSLIAKNIDFNSADLELTNGGVGCSIDYRFYNSNNNQARGFYYGPYINFSNYSIAGMGQVDFDDVVLTGNLLSVGAGMKLGVHWILSDILSIDWYIIGLGVNYHSAYVDLFSVDPQVNYEEVADVINDIKVDVPIIGKNITTEVSDEILKTKLNTFLPGIKAGISIGITF